MHLCPICGFNGLEDPPKDFTICPCCGTEFGYDDAFATTQTLRAEWMLNGYRWWSPVDTPPPDWNALEQIRKLREHQTLIELTSAANEALARANEILAAAHEFSSPSGNTTHYVFYTTIAQQTFPEKKQINRGNENYGEGFGLGRISPYGLAAAS